MDISSSAFHPLLGQRVKDILTVVACLRNSDLPRTRGLVVAARGTQTVPALFAAALDSSITGLYLVQGLVSFRNLLATEVYNYPFANFLPRLLHHTDLPELAASLAPRDVVLAGSVDAEGTRLDRAAVESAYGSARNVIARAEPLWDFSTLASLPR